MSKQKKTGHRSRWSAFRARLERLSAGRVLLLALVSGILALLLVDWVRVPTDTFQEGDVAPYDVRAPVSFSFVDEAATRAEQELASRAVPVVFGQDGNLAARLADRVSLAFETARRKLMEAREKARRDGKDRPPGSTLEAIQAEFLATLDLAVDAESIRVLADRDFDEEIEALANELISVAMRRYVVADRSILPESGVPISVIRLVGDNREEQRLQDFTEVVTVEEARQELALYVLNRDPPAAGAQALKAAAAIARSAVRPTFSANPLLTEERRQAARSAVQPVMVEVKEGTMLFRAGDVLGADDIAAMKALRGARGPSDLVTALIALSAFCGLVVGTFYFFSSDYVSRFARTNRTLEAMAFLLVLLLGLGRTLVDVGAAVFPAGGGGPTATSLWYLLPIAGGAMLVRILANAETALVFAIVISLLAGVVMDRQVLVAVFFLLSSVAAIGGVAQARERVQVLRAGLQAGIVNVAVVVLVDLVQLYLRDLPSLGFGTVLWDAIFAFLGGGLAGVLVLGLVPVFEAFGFVTDYKLLELANFNHPLLRQLMIRAPGTYHHSVMVGSLAEAAAEAVGADSLLVRVGAYFHDIGKISKPHFFIENQRDVPNPHDRLPPEQSASAIIRHVATGARIARENKLPQPLIDLIESHHGTGVVSFFLERAQRMAEPSQTVREEDFRYPGPKPDTREAAILLLADRVEAACRAIQRPTPDTVRATIQRLVSSALNDGQLEACPLTLKDLHRVANTFAEVVLGLYHQRIEYPDGAAQTDPGTSRSGIITIEVANPLGPAMPLAPPQGFPAAGPGGGAGAPEDLLRDDEEETGSEEFRDWNRREDD
ncbi:MAG: HDIG domain-containing protein [Deltaproteobacteria bacterium]|nr:HDIG domain-containing protein [Deltaproteobacteria bacterium]